MPISQIVTNSIADDVTIKFADGSASTPSITNNGDTNTGIFFPAADTIAFSEGGVESMRIDGSGNLGIGISNPVQKLDVSGTAVASGISARVTNTDSNAAARAGIQFKTGTNANVWQTFARNNQLVFGVDTVADYMIIESNGDVAIGNTGGKNAGLAVTGVSKTCMFAETTTTSDVFYVLGNTGGSSSSAVYVIPCRFGSTQTFIGGIYYNGSVLSLQGTSDYRLKENIAPLQNALGIVQQLNPVTYTWKTSGKSGTGFIAHELQTVLPDAVVGEKNAVDDKGEIVPQSIDQASLIVYLTKAIQELKATVDAQAARIAALEAR